LFILSGGGNEALEDAQGSAYTSFWLVVKSVDKIQLFSLLVFTILDSMHVC